MDSDLDLDLTYFEKGGFDLDLDLNFIGFDLKNLKSTPNPSRVRRVNFFIQMPLPFWDFAKKNCEPLPPHP